MEYRGVRTLLLSDDVSVNHIASRLGSGGDGVCPKLRLKGRRGRITAASKLPVTRDIPGDSRIRRSRNMTIRISKRAKQLYWRNLALCFILDVALSVAAGLIVNSFQFSFVFYFLMIGITWAISLKRFIYNWLDYKLGGKEILSDIALSKLTEMQAPEPGESATDPETYFEDIAIDEKFPIELRLRAAGEKAILQYLAQAGHSSEALKWMFAYKDVLKLYRSRFHGLQKWM